MRKRCFIIAAIALAIGVYFQIEAIPSPGLVEMTKTVNRGSRLINERIRNADYGTFYYGKSYQEISNPNPNAPNSTYVAIGNSSFVIAGVLLLVGFIVGPEKKERLIAQPPPLPPKSLIPPPPPTEKLLK